MIHAAIAEVPQERIAGAEREKCDRRLVGPMAEREKTVNNFIRCAIPANGNKPAIAFAPGVTCKLRCVAGGGSLPYVDINAAAAESLQRRAEKLARASAARCGVHNGQVAGWRRGLHLALRMTGHTTEFLMRFSLPRCESVRPVRSA